MKSIFSIQIALLLLFLTSNSSFAQRKTISNTYRTWAIETFITFKGNITYQYIIDKNGEHIKDGQYSITTKSEGFKLGNFSSEKDGYFNINTNYNKGKLHGPLNFKFKYTISNKTRSGIERKTGTITYLGNFSNGIPNGNFIITRNLGWPEDVGLNVTFKDGILVGNYYCKIADDYQYITTSGTLTSEGELTGIWKIEDSKDTKQKEFKNNVLISETSRDKSTKPYITELAKQYADGTISEENLFEKGFIVKEGTLNLGSNANLVIFDDILNMKKHVANCDRNDRNVTEYDFSTNNNKIYKYLHEINILDTDNFYDISQKILNGDSEYEIIEIDEFTIIKNYREQFYLTSEQIQFLKNAFSEMNKNNALPFGLAITKLGSKTNEYHYNTTDAVHSYLSNSKTQFSYNDYIKIKNNSREIIPYYFNMDLYSFVPGNSSYLYYNKYSSEFNPYMHYQFIDRESVRNDIILLYILADKFNELTKNTIYKENKEYADSLKVAIEKKYKNDILNSSNFNTCIREFINDNSRQFTYQEYMIFRHESAKFIVTTIINNNQNTIYKSFNPRFSYIFFAMANLDDESICKILDNNNIEIGYARSIQEEYNKKRYCDLKLAIENIFNNLLNKKISEIEEDKNTYFYYDDIEDKQIHKEFIKRLKPFTQMINYEIINIKGENFDEIEVIIYTKKKKYKVIWNLFIPTEGNIKLKVNSINKNMAIEI